MKAIKQHVALEALKHIQSDMVVGMGTGSTVNELIDALPELSKQCRAFVASSKATEERLKAIGCVVDTPNQHSSVDIYLDGADECDPHGRLIKGGGGAMTGERIVANMAKRFVCLVDYSKMVPVLGKFPVAVEVLPMARSQVARALLALGGDPVYRENVKTDHGNDILDVYGLPLADPKTIETVIEHMPGVVGHGLFSQLKPQLVLVGHKDGSVETVQVG